MTVKKRYLLTLLALLVFGLAMTALEPKKSSARHHQHQKPGQERLISDLGNFQSHLPVLSIDTAGQRIPEERFSGDDSLRNPSITSQLSVYEVGSQDKDPDMSTLAQVAYRGNSSRHFDKKSLKIRLVNKKQEDHNLPLLGMAEESEWVLHGPFLDRSLVRNYLSYNIAGEIMEYAPNVRYCELFIDGQYQGLYLLVESIEQGPDRIAIDKSDKKAAQTSYIVVWDRKHKAKQPVDNYVSYIHQAGVSGLDIRYPGVDRLTPDQADYITKDVSRIEKTLYSYDLKKYNQDLDRNAFAEYFIINEFFRNVDAGKFSTYLYKDLRNKMKLVVWDFNNAMDNQIETDYDAAGFTMLDVPWFSMLIKDREFVDLVVHKYRELRKSKLSTTYLTQYVEDTVDFLGSAIDRNNEKWGYVFDLDKPDSRNYLVPVDRNMTSYEESVDQVKDFIEDRGRWLDKHIETLYQYTSPSKNANTLLD